MNEWLNWSFFFSQFPKSQPQPSHGPLRPTFAVCVSPTECLRVSVYPVTQDAFQPPPFSLSWGRVASYAALLMVSWVRVAARARGDGAGCRWPAGSSRRCGSRSRSWVQVEPRELGSVGRRGQLRTNRVIQNINKNKVRSLHRAFKCSNQGKLVKLGHTGL